MSDFIKDLRNIIATTPNFISQDDRGNKITLQETQPNSSCDTITLRKTATKTLTLKVDINDFNAHPLIKDNLGIKLHPDYLIFCDNEKSGLLVLIAELKSSNLKSTGKTGRLKKWEKQLKVGITIAKYLVAMLESYKETQFTINYRGILFSSTPLKERQNPSQRKRSLTKAKKLNWRKHKVYDFDFVHKNCGREYDIEFFLQ